MMDMTDWFYKGVQRRIGAWRMRGDRIRVGMTCWQMLGLSRHREVREVEEEPLSFWGSVVNQNHTLFEYTNITINTNTCNVDMKTAPVILTVNGSEL